MNILGSRALTLTPETGLRSPIIVLIGGSKILDGAEGHTNATAISMLLLRQVLPN